MCGYPPVMKALSGTPASTRNKKHVHWGQLCKSEPSLSERNHLVGCWLLWGEGGGEEERRGQPLLSPEAALSHLSRVKECNSQLDQYDHCQPSSCWTKVSSALSTQIFCCFSASSHRLLPTKAPQGSFAEPGIGTSALLLTLPNGTPR